MEGKKKKKKRKSYSEEHESMCKAEVCQQQAVQIKKTSKCTVNDTETISLRDTREATHSVFKSL